MEGLHTLHTICDTPLLNFPVKFPCFHLRFLGFLRIFFNSQMLPMIRIFSTGSELCADPRVPTSLPKPSLGRQNSISNDFFQHFLSCAFANMQICALVFLGAFLLLNFTDFTHMEKERQKWRNLISKWRARFKQQVWTGHHSSPSPSSPSSSQPSDGESDAGGKLGLDECDHPRIWHFCKVGSRHRSSSLGFWPRAALS